MPDFQYIARELSGRQVTGTLSATGEADALASLAGRGLFPVRVDLAEEAKAQQRHSGRRVGARYLAIFYSQLADLLKSGVPLLRSLELLHKQTHVPALRAVLDDVRADVADGTRLAEAMRRHPKAFNELAVSMVRAGEEGGFMEDVLKRIAAFTEHQQELQSRVVGAMVYPLFLLGMGTAIVIGMVGFFVPKFQPIFDQMDERGNLPAATTALMSLSEFVGGKGGLLLFAAVVGGGFALYRYITTTEEGRLRWDAFRLSGLKFGGRTFGLGPIVRSLAIARFCRILGTLLHNGVPILQSLRIAKDATGNLILSRAIGEAADSVSTGKSLAKPLSSSGQFPEEVVEMISVGEEANNLEQVLIDIAENMERHTNRQLELFVRMLEPVMLTLIAGVILFLVIALMLPILQSSGIM
ncbi:MAG: type II secretion system F family protein [Planctomycetaceae bacterium]